MTDLPQAAGDQVTGDARIVDLGFTHFEGERRGRAAAVLALARWSALRALGARRPWTAKLVPVALVMLAFGPALVVLGLKALVGSRIDTLPEILPYDGYYAQIAVVVLLFAGMTAPELLCPDRHDRVLDLYLATAVSPFEYVLGKLLAAVIPILFLTLVPQLTLFVGNAIFDDDAVGYVRDNADIPLRIVAAGLILAFYWSLLGLAVSSLTDRRTFAVGGMVGLVLVSAVIGGTLAELTDDDEYAVMVLGFVPIATVVDLFGTYEGPPTAGWFWASLIVVMAVSTLVIAWRYRRTSR